MNASTRKKSTTRRPDGRSYGRVLAATIFKGIDFWAGLTVGGAVGYVAATTDLIDGADFLPWLSALGFTIALGVWAAERWLDDRVPASSDYGQLVGIIDPEGRAMLHPYIVTALVAFAGGVSSGIAALIAPAVGGGVASGLVHGIPAWILTWAIAGLLETILITHRHLRDQRELANLRAELEAEQRRRPHGPEREQDG
ncbi:MAG: hypothetical protein M3O70_25700 [Actinomycetota bacterium]|nr:hypothetical protein [Actinomycetota bacterium]